jgi:histone H3/H4
MTRTLTLLLATLALLLVAGLSLSGHDAWGARSSKPKEIVVVGSKVKEVIREAGLRSDGELVQAVSDKVHELLEDSVKRAASNRRRPLRFFDIDCWSEEAVRELIVIRDQIRDELDKSGFAADDAYIRTLSDTTYAVLDDAIFRAKANGRQTVKASDI